MALVKTRGSQNRTTITGTNVGRGLLGRDANYRGGKEIRTDKGIKANRIHYTYV